MLLYTEINDNYHNKICIFKTNCSKDFILQVDLEALNEVGIIVNSGK